MECGWCLLNSQRLGFFQGYKRLSTIRLAEYTHKPPAYVSHGVLLRDLAAFDLTNNPQRLEAESRGAQSAGGAPKPLLWKLVDHARLWFSGHATTVQMLSATAGCDTRLSASTLSYPCIGLITKHD